MKYLILQNMIHYNYLVLIKCFQNIISLIWWFATKGQSCPIPILENYEQCLGTMNNVWGQFWLPQLKVGQENVLPASTGQRPVMIPNTMQCTRQPPQQQGIIQVQMSIVWKLRNYILIRMANVKPHKYILTFHFSKSIS